MSLDLLRAAVALRGDIVGGQVIAPGPGHSAKDRSLAVKMTPRCPAGSSAGHMRGMTGRPAVTT